MLACTPGSERIDGSRSGGYRSRSLEHPDLDGLAVGFVVEDDQGRRRSVRGSPDIPRPVEHAWAPDGHLAYLVPAYGPVYVVMSHELDAWLAGAEPKRTYQKIEAPGPAKQLSHLRWTGPGELRFDAACCGSVAEVSVDVSRGSLRVGPWRPAHPRRP